VETKLFKTSYLILNFGKREREKENKTPCPPNLVVWGEKGEERGGKSLT